MIVSTRPRLDDQPNRAPCCAAAYVLLLLLFAVFSADAAVRTWTNREGMTLRAEYVTHAGDQVTLRREIDDKLFILEAGTLSADDRRYLEQNGPEIDRIRHLENPLPVDLGNLGKMVMDGNGYALEALNEVAERLYLDLDPEKDRPRAQANSRLLRPVFTSIGLAAGGGDRTAFLSLIKSMDYSLLRSFTADAFGRGAGEGSEDCLEVLLNPGQYGFPLASSVSALRYAAANKNAHAVEFLTNVLLDETKKPLWYMASSALEAPAKAGDSLAAHALKVHSERE